MLTLLTRFSKYSVVLLGFLAITLLHAQDERADDTSILDVDASGEVDALTDGLLILRSMFELTDDALVTGVVDSTNCKECDAEGIDQYISNVEDATYGKLSSYDDQNISGSSLDGTNLIIGIENGNSETIDLSSLEDGVGITPAQASAITTNTAKTGITSEQATAITDNTAKTGITEDQASAITTNTAKIGITSNQVNELNAVKNALNCIADLEPLGDEEEHEGEEGEEHDEEHGDVTYSDFWVFTQACINDALGTI